MGYIQKELLFNEAAWRKHLDGWQGLRHEESGQEIYDRLRGEDGATLEPLPDSFPCIIVYQHSMNYGRSYVQYHYVYLSDFGIY